MIRRGLTLIEFLLALGVTAIVAMAIAGMMGAVSSGATARSDFRAVTVLANAASSRLSAYIVPSRCVLDLNGSDATLWLDDSRESETVHATEIRWLQFDGDAGTFSVHYVDFPDAWSQAACDLEDLEYPANTDWDQVLSTYESKGWTSSRILVDELASVSVFGESQTPTSCHMLCFELGFQTQDAVVEMIASAAITQHATPIK